MSKDEGRSVGGKPRTLAFDERSIPHQNSCVKDGRMRLADCHPDRKHRAFGLCASCYQKYRGFNSYEYKAGNPERKAKHIERVKQWKFKNDFGITIADRDRIAKSQDYKCAICGNHESSLGKRLALDHSHKTLKIRGLLCTGCNWLIARADDNPELLLRAARYLDGSN